MKRKLIVQICCLGLWIGIIIARFAYFNSWADDAIIVMVIIVLILVLRRFLPLITYYFLIIILAGGIGFVRWRMSTALPNNDVSRFITESVVAITGQVSAEPEVSGRTQGLTIKVAQIDGRAASGLARVSASLYPEYSYGDYLKVKCALMLPQPEGYRSYLLRWGVSAVCYRPYITKLSSLDSISLNSYLFEIKQKVSNITSQILSEPQASLLAGLLWGSRSGLPEDVQNQYRRTGMAHQIAVSGFNTTIIAAAVTALLMSFGLRRRVVVIIAGLFLMMFVIISGASAAVVRAALMSGTTLLARETGRVSSIGQALLLVSTIMVAVNPWIITDIGFQLSLSATAGLIYLSPLVSSKLTWLSEKFALRETVACTLAATVATIPVSICHFGQISIISPLANALTLPLLPLTMAIGAIGIAFGLIWLTLGQIAGLLVWLLLSYLLLIPRTLSAWPMAAANMPALGYWAFILYVPIILLIIRTKNYEKKSY